MSKRQRKSSLSKSNKSKAQSHDVESETSLGTSQLQEKASRTTEGVFSQMLSRSK
jgi:hypothetical protein